MRVKVYTTDEVKEQLEFGKKYAIFLYGSSPYLTFTFTRKKNVYIYLGRSESKTADKMSKRKLKQLLREDFVQWVVEETV